MPELAVRIKKKSDGSAALSCVRADGSTTWQQQNGKLALFFPLHDLTHYAVETVLGFRQAFYGLVAEGWDLTDFGSDARGKIPGEALLAEVIVGMFDLERMTGVRETASEMNVRIVEHYTNNNAPSPSFRLTDDQVARVRETRADLFARWKAVAAGDTLVLEFDRGHKSGGVPVG